MIFKNTDLEGAKLILPERILDERGFFSRTFCRSDFQAQGLASDFIVQGVSFSPARGTLRGLHYQVHPHEEEKVVRCTRGRIFDVIVDLRKTSPTYKRWLGLELSADNGQALYIPKGFAHGLLTLEDSCEVSYMLSKEYHEPSARGLRFDDPSLSIEWPFTPCVIAERDRNFPLMVV